MTAEEFFKLAKHEFAEALKQPLPESQFLGPPPQWLEMPPGSDYHAEILLRLNRLGDLIEVRELAKRCALFPARIGLKLLGAADRQLSLDGLPFLREANDTV